MKMYFSDRGNSEALSFITDNDKDHKLFWYEILYTHQLFDIYTMHLYMLMMVLFM